MKDAEDYGLSTAENPNFSQFKSEFLQYQNWMNKYNTIFTNDSFEILERKNLKEIF